MLRRLFWAVIGAAVAGGFIAEVARLQRSMTPQVQRSLQPFQPEVPAPAWTFERQFYGITREQLILYTRP
jgi:hypothetical protein